MAELGHALEVLFEQEKSIRQQAAQFVPAHRSVLAQTAQLAALCSYPVQKGPPEHVQVPPFRIKDGNCHLNISPEAFDCMLKFVYYLESDIPPAIAAELIPWTVDYNMMDLQKLCYDIIQASIIPESFLSILGCTYMPYADIPNFQYVATVEKIRKNAMAYVVVHLSEIGFSKLGKMNPQIAVDVLLAIQADTRGLSTEKAEKASPFTPLNSIREQSQVKIERPQSPDLDHADKKIQRSQEGQEG